MATGAAASLATPGCCLPSEPRGREPFATWREIRDALRSSQHHTLRRSEDLVATQQFDALEAFVRERIRVLPGRTTNIGGTLGDMSYGTDYALLCGAGTPRERAELLASFLRDAGATDVEVRSGRLRPEHVDAAYDACYRTPLPDLPVLEVDDRTYARWQSVLGSTDSDSPDLSGANAFADTLLDSLDPEDRPEPTFTRGTVKNLPIVKATVDGAAREFRALYLGLPATAFEDKTYGIPKANDYDNVRVRLLGYRAGSDDAEVLVEGNWPTNALAGKHLHLCTRPMVPPEALGLVAPRQVTAFLPTLVRVAPDGLPFEEDACVGTPMAVSGETLDLETGTVGSRELVEPSGRAADVTSLAMTVSTARWPTIDLTVMPRDADGKVVEGLTPADFRVEDDGPQPVLMRSNAKSLRVIVLYDTSLSMPAVYRGRKPEFLTELTDTLEAELPQALVTSRGVGSNIWTAASKAARSEADVIVYATDGHNQDKEAPWMKNALSSGPAFFMLAVENEPTEVIQRVAALSGGKVLAITELDAAVRAVAQELEGLDLAPVRLSYRAPVADPGSSPAPRDLTLAMATGSTEATGNYQPPESTADAEPSSWVGLRLEVKVSRWTYHSHIAGWNPRDFKRSATYADERDVWHQLFGETRLHLEGEGTKTVLMLDNLLSNRIAREPLVEALEADDTKAALETLSDGRFPLDARALALIGPLHLPPEREVRTFFSGPRIVVSNTRPGTNTATLLHTADLMRTSQVVCTDDDRSEAARHIARASLTILALEGALYERSAYGLTSDKVYPQPKAALKERDVTSDERHWMRIWLPGIAWVNLDERAGFDLEKDGNLYGVLGPGHGGGASAEDIKRQLNELDAVLDSLAFGLGVVGVWTPALGLVAQYGKLLARLYAAVTEALIIMDVSGLDDAMRAALQGFACNIYKEIVFGVMGTPGTYLAGLDALIGQMTDYSLVECPK